MSAEMIEAVFLARRDQAPDLPGAFELAFAAALGALGADPALQRLHRAGHLVAEAIDAAARQAGGREPAFHDRYHMAEATLAMGRLCGEALRQGLLERRDVAAGLVAMAGHDMHHDGSFTGGGVLEARSAAAVAAVCAQAGLCGPAESSFIQDVIRGTDPAEVAANAARVQGSLPPGPGGRAQDIVQVLANEADVFGSLLPRLGLRLSEALAIEWRNSTDPVQLAAGTPCGRLRFLEGYPVLSAPAVAAGLGSARARSIAAYGVAGRLLGVAATPAAGSAALNRLAPEEATAVYVKALALAG